MRDYRRGRLELVAICPKRCVAKVQVCRLHRSSQTSTVPLLSPNATSLPSCETAIALMLVMSVANARGSGALAETTPAMPSLLAITKPSPVGAAAYTMPTPRLGRERAFPSRLPLEYIAPPSEDHRAIILPSRDGRHLYGSLQ